MYKLFLTHKIHFLYLFSLKVVLKKCVHRFSVITNPIKFFFLAFLTRCKFLPTFSLDD